MEFFSYKVIIAKEKQGGTENNQNCTNTSGFWVVGTVRFIESRVGVHIHVVLDSNVAEVIGIDVSSRHLESSVGPHKFFSFSKVGNIAIHNSIGVGYSFCPQDYIHSTDIAFKAMPEEIMPNLLADNKSLQLL
jgi:hypothetical protein